MDYIPIEKLLDRTSNSIYKLVIIASKRTLEIAEGQPKLAAANSALKPSNIALQEIAEVCDIAVVKTGKSGSVIEQSHQTYAIGVIDVNAVDTTGAGDLYAAGFLYGYSIGLPLDKCGKIGALLAGKVIEDYGAKLAEQKWVAIKDEITRIIKK